MGCSNSSAIPANENTTIKELDDTPQARALNNPANKAAQAFIDQALKEKLDKKALDDIFEQNKDFTVKSAGIYGQTLLHVAASEGAVEACEHLIKKYEADVNAKDTSGDTPLHYAANMSKFKVVKFLLEKKAKVDAVNEGGQSALLKAINQDDKKEQAPKDIEETVKALCRGHADVNLASKSGTTPLIEAVHDVPSIVKYLIEHNASADSQNKEGSTALMVACQLGRLDIVQILVKEGHANIELTDKEKKSAQDHAEAGKHEEIVQFLNKSDTGCACL